MTCALQAVTRISRLAVPKQLYTREQLEFLFGVALTEDRESWLVSCIHTLEESATQHEIDAVEHKTQRTVPIQLRELYTFTNGSELFVVPLEWLKSSFSRPKYTRYHIFNCKETIEVNEEVNMTIQQMYRGDPDLDVINDLGVLVFCDAHDGNYLGIATKSQYQGVIVFLDHETSYRPFTKPGDISSFFVSSSLDNWIQHLINTQGWDGFGGRVIRL